MRRLFQFETLFEVSRKGQIKARKFKICRFLSAVELIVRGLLLEKTYLLSWLVPLNTLHKVSLFCTRNKKLFIIKHFKVFFIVHVVLKQTNLSFGSPLLPH